MCLRGAVEYGADDPSVTQSVFTFTEKAPTRALKVPTSAFTFKALLRHYATPVSLMMFSSATQFHVYLSQVNAQLTYVSILIMTLM